MHQFFPSTFFNFETVRILGTTTHGGCEAAEFLDAISQIKSSDPTSWHTAWSHQALKAESLGISAARSGDRAAARNAYLRASNYTRASGYMFVSEPSRSLPVAEKTIQLFRSAIPFFDHPVHLLEIPYQDTKLPGYLHLPAPSRRLRNRPAPILINTGGADSVQEELYYLHPSAGPGLGYAVVTFEGPGQGIVLRRDRSRIMRPDWEVVTSAVIDHVCELAQRYPELDLDVECIALAGASMGGYFALRGAIDARVQACVSVDPFFDMWEFVTSHISPRFIGAWEGGWIGDWTVDRVVEFGKKWDFQLRWEVGVCAGFWGLDGAGPARILREMKSYTLKGQAEDGVKGEGEGESLLKKVRCPVLVTGAGKSLYFDTEAHTMRIARELGHLGEENLSIWMPSVPGEGGLQAKMGALALCNQKTYEFLDRVFEVKRDVVGREEPNTILSF